MIRKSYKFRIYPTKAQILTLETTLELCRELYNAALQERRDAWRLNRISISYYDQQNQLPEIKRERQEFSNVHSQVLCNVLNRINKSFANFFSCLKKGTNAGFPRFKSSNRFNSFIYPQVSNCAVNLEANKLNLPKIGKIKINLSRPVVGKVKTCVIKREIDKWFVVFSVETIAEPLPKTGKEIGIDVGIESFATLSDSTKIENPKFFESTQKKLRVAQRRVSRRKKGSNQRRKAVLQLRKIHEKICNQRNDFQHKVSTQIIKDFDLIAIEKLNILGMSKGILSKQIHDVAWSSFFQKLTYKAENAGRQLIKVNPSGTSQTCVCGEIVKKKLSIRHHKCLKCGYENHRDIVSAQVILNRAGLAREAQT